ncbi:MAG: hypothetical protein FJ291_02830 [Planctomycetes bacterium]|nr:hypothetical protein [Planctomycetota bacterium]
MASRVWSVAVLSCALALGGQSAWGHAFYGLACPRTRPGGVRIDGDVAAWPQERFIQVPHTRVSFGSPRSAKDISFRFAAMWDRWFLYVAVVVTDDSLVAAQSLERLYEGDCVEICLDVNNDSEGGYDGSDYQFVIAPTGPGNKPRVNLYRNPFFHIEDRQWLHVAANVTPDGYILEAAFSWKQLEVVPRLGQTIGFEIDVRDYDADGSKKGIAWAPAADPAANPLRWGDLVLTNQFNADVTLLVEPVREQNERWQRLLGGTARETDNEVAIAVLPKPVGRLALGLGWNVQFRDGRFPAWSDATWNSFLELLGWTRPAWLRYGVNLGQWEPRNDDPDPTHPNWEGFAFRSKAMLNHYRVLDFCEKRGIDVAWANWCIGDRASGVHWLAESTRKPAIADPDNDPYTDAPYDPEEFAESIAACLHHLKTVRNYTCVKQVSLWNEPDQGWSFNSSSAGYPKPFWSYYDVLARHLVRLGIRDAVKILGPEVSTGSYETLPALGGRPTYSREVDILAHHDYLGYADHHRVDRGAPIARGTKAYGELTGRARPVAVTEFGNTGNGSEEVTGDAAVWAGSLSCCRLVVEGLNAGVAGFLRWEFKPYGVSWQNFGALTTLSQRWLYEPYRPVFFPHALLCHAATKGADVLTTATRGGLDENGVPRVACTVLSHRDTGTAVILVNDGFQPKKVMLSFDAKLPGGIPLRLGHLSYDASLPPGLVKGADIAVTDGKAALTLPPRSVHALSTRPGFTQVPELPALPPREEPQYTTRKADRREEDVALMRFGADYDWRVWQSTAGHTAFGAGTDPQDAANPVCRIAYDMVGVLRNQRPEHVVAHTDLIVRGKPLRVAFRVHADASRLRLAVIFLDAKGEVFEHQDFVSLDWTGWRRVEKAIADFPKDWGQWNGDGVPDYPLRGFGFTLAAPDTEFKGKGIILIDEVEIASQPPPAGR